MEISISDEFSGAVLQVWRALGLLPPTLQVRALLQSWAVPPSHLRTEAALRAEVGGLSEMASETAERQPSLGSGGRRPGQVSLSTHCTCYLSGGLVQVPHPLLRQLLSLLTPPA